MVVDVLFRASARSAEGVLEENVTVQTKPVYYDECVWQICLQHQYSAARELDEYKAQHEESSQAEKGDGDDDDEASKKRAKGSKSYLKQVKSLERGKRNEQRLNEQYMKSRAGTPILYGDVIQLRHCKSQKFITIADNEVANVERFRAPLCAGYG